MSRRCSGHKCGTQSSGPNRPKPPPHRAYILAGCVRYSCIKAESFPGDRDNKVSRGKIPARTTQLARGKGERDPRTPFVQHPVAFQGSVKRTGSWPRAGARQQILRERTAVCLKERHLGRHPAARTMSLGPTTLWLCDLQQNTKCLWSSAERSGITRPVPPLAHRGFLIPPPTFTEHLTWVDIALGVCQKLVESLFPPSPFPC